MEIATDLSFSTVGTTATPFTMSSPVANQSVTIETEFNILFGNLSNSQSKLIASAMVSGITFFVVIAVLFLRQIPVILQTSPPKFIARTMVLSGIYTIVGAAALTSLLVFKARVFCDSICHFAFVICAYHYFCLCIEYSGGETNFIKRTSGLMSFNVQTPPLCCCLSFLQPSSMTKPKFRYLRLMVLQMSIVQGLLLAILNVINTVESTIYEKILPFFVPFIVISILIGVWALQINARMITPYLPQHNIMKKYFCIQLVLILCKLQPAIIQLISYIINMITGQEFATKLMENTFIQLLILLEMVLLSVLANRVYKIPIKGTEY